MWTSNNVWSDVSRWLRGKKWQGWKLRIKNSYPMPLKRTFRHFNSKNKHDNDDQYYTFAWNSVSCHLTCKYIHFWRWRRMAANCKDGAGKTLNRVEREAQQSRWFQSFCPRRFILNENTKRERWVESGSANYSSALPLLCFRNIGTGTWRSFNSHRQHRAMLANLTAQSNHSWHIGSFTPSKISNIISHPCLQTRKSADFSHLWSSGREKTA